MTHSSFSGFFQVSLNRGGCVRSRRGWFSWLPLLGCEPRSWRTRSALRLHCLWMHPKKKSERGEESPKATPSKQQKPSTRNITCGLDMSEGKGSLRLCRYLQSCVAEGFGLRSGRPLFAINFCSVTCHSKEGISHGLKN